MQKNKIKNKKIFKKKRYIVLNLIMLGNNFLWIFLWPQKVQKINKAAGNGFKKKSLNKI